MKNYFRAVFLLLFLAMGFTYYHEQKERQPVVSVIKNSKGEPTISRIDVIPSRDEQATSVDLVRTSDVPLFLQTANEWKDISYGSDGDRNIAENGCAIVTLAMVGNYYGLESTPSTIKDWAQEDYYVEGAGTSWEIFGDFALEHDLEFLNLGNDIEWAKEELSKGHLVVVSVDVSQFTEVGHIMLLTGVKDNQFSLNDPNDDEETKFHNYNWYDSDIIEGAAINYWSYSL